MPVILKLFTYIGIIAILAMIHAHAIEEPSLGSKSEICIAGDSQYQIGDVWRSSDQCSVCQCNFNESTYSTYTRCTSAPECTEQREEQRDEITKNLSCTSSDGEQVPIGGSAFPASDSCNTCYCIESNSKAIAVCSNKTCAVNKEGVEEEVITLENTIEKTVMTNYSGIYCKDLKEVASEKFGLLKTKIESEKQQNFIEIEAMTQKVSTLTQELKQSTSKSTVVDNIDKKNKESMKIANIKESELTVAQNQLNELLYKQSRLEQAIQDAHKQLTIETALANEHNDDFDLYETTQQTGNNSTGQLAKSVNSNIKIMTIANVAMKKLVCEPVGDVAAISYPLFQSASAIFIANQINIAKHLKKKSTCLSDINVGKNNQDMTSQKNLQVEIIKRASEMYSALRESIELQLESKNEVLAGYLLAKEAAEIEVKSKVERINKALAQVQKNMDWVAKNKKTTRDTGIALATLHLGIPFTLPAIVALKGYLTWLVATDKPNAERALFISQVELTAARKHTHLACNYNEATLWNLSGVENNNGTNSNITEVEQGLAIKERGSRFAQYLKASKENWQNQAFNAQDLLNMNENPINLASLQENQWGLPLPSTRLKYINMVIEEISNSNLPKLHATLETVKREIQGHNSILIELGEIPQGSNLQGIVDGTPITKISELTAGSCLDETFKHDHSCKCKNNNNCASFSLPQIGSPRDGVMATFADTANVTNNAANLSLAGDLQSASLEKAKLGNLKSAYHSQVAELNENARKIGLSQMDLISAVVPSTKRFDTNNATSKPLIKRRKTNGDSSLMLPDSTDHSGSLSDNSETKGNNNTSNNRLNQPGDNLAGPSPLSNSIEPNSNSGGRTFNDSTFSNSNDQNRRANNTDDNMVFPRQSSSGSTRYFSEKDVNRESEVSIFKNISRRYLKTGFKALGGFKSRN